MPFGIGHPPPIHQMQCICVVRLPNLQTEFNYLDSFKSYGIFSDFVVPTLSPWSPHCACCPHIIPVIPTSSLSSPHHPHSPQKVPMCSSRLWSPWSPPMLSPSSLPPPHHPRCPHVIPTLSRRSPDHSQSPRYPSHPPPGGWCP